MEVYNDTEQLYQSGYERVERDDRLLDVFSKDTSEKGVELWVKFGSEIVEIIRFWNGQRTEHEFDTAKIETALLHNKRLTLS